MQLTSAFALGTLFGTTVMHLIARREVKRIQREWKFAIRGWDSAINMADEFRRKAGERTTIVKYECLCGKGITETQDLPADLT